MGGQNHMDVVFQCFIDFTGKEYQYHSIHDAKISTMSKEDSRIILQHEKTVEIMKMNDLSKTLFTHEASKKAVKITNFIVHPLLKNVICCCDDPKSVQIFWYQCQK